MKIPRAFAAHVDALLRGLDPRATEQQRRTALDQAAGEPDFIIGLLAQILTDYHRRAEQLAALPPGHYVDRLRTEAFGTLAPDDLLGFAIHSATAGEQISFVAVSDPRVGSGAGQPAPGWKTAGPFDSDWIPPEDIETERGLAPARAYPLTVRPDAPMIPRPAPEAEPRTPRPIAEVAAAAEVARRQRLEDELMRGAIGQGQGYPGGREGRGAIAESDPPEPYRPPIEDHAFPAEDFRQNGVEVVHPDDPRLAGLLGKLREQRAQENAVDVADPDRPASMGAAIRASQGASEPAAPAPALPAPLSPNRTYAPQARPAAPIPAQPELPTCGHMTSRGPCALFAGHPVAPGLPGEEGHISQEMTR